LKDCDDTSRDVLDRLAALAGIEDGWVDFFGTYRPASPETKKAFLAAMGLAVRSEDEIAASLAELASRPWRSWHDPVRVAKVTDGPPEITLTFPVSRDLEHIDWTVIEERGAVHVGELRPVELPQTGEREVDGELRRRRSFRLPISLPPGIHKLKLEATDKTRTAMTLIVTPATAYLPPVLAKGGRLWGYATQLYALRRQGNWGVGDFTDLAELTAGAAGDGAAAVGVNPLHALFTSRPERFSPYSPSSRLFLNTAYIDVEAVPDFGESAEAQALFAAPTFQETLAAARGTDLVDYAAIGPLKLAVLEACWTSFKARHLGRQESPRAASFWAFHKDGGRKAERFVAFEALQESILRGNPDKSYWRHWPEPYQNPDSPAVAAFVLTNRDRVEFHWYLQWLADDQLKQAHAAGLKAGMAIGIYRDLAVGIAGDGAEAWANQHLLCLGVSVGAPPDPLNLAGQDWGLVPFNPLALREAAYLPFLDVLEANMTHAGAMRLDHAMCLQRLYWVPSGVKADQGAYVRYPVDDLFGLVALASQRKKCVIIGEDLGVVPDGFRQRLDESGILGYRLAVFEKDHDRMKAPAVFPAQALVGFGTHDLPSLAGWWNGIDIAERTRLDLYPDPAMGPREVEERAEDRARLVRGLSEDGLLAEDFPTTPDLKPAQMDALAAAIYDELARTPSMLLMVQFEDVLGLSIQMNLPGTTDQHPNWRLRYPFALSKMLADDRLTGTAKRLTVARERGSAEVE